MGPFRPYFPKLTSSSENLRKIFGKSSESVGKGSGRVGKARRKKEGGVGGGWQERKKGGVGGVSDDVIKKKNEKMKNKK